MTAEMFVHSWRNAGLCSVEEVWRLLARLTGRSKERLTLLPPLTATSHLALACLTLTVLLHGHTSLHYDARMMLHLHARTPMSLPGPGHVEMHMLHQVVQEADLSGSVL
jgi:hypothetical protein